MKTLEKTALGIIIVLIVVIIVITIYTFFCWLADRKLKLINRECADIIIIGAGTAGSVLGRRLHERHPRLKILIMERGQDRHADPKVYNIAKALEIAYTEPYSETIPTKVSSSLAELEVKAEVSIARLTGGGSSHSFALAVYGSPDFYNAEWQEQLGLSYDDLNKSCGIFDRIENQIEINMLPVKFNILEMIGPALKKAYCKYDPLEATRILERTATVAANVGPLRAPDTISDVILKAIKRTKPNVKIVEDYNSKITACASKNPQLFVDGILGIRNSADVAYIPHSYLLNECHTNLHVGEDMTTDKLLMRGKSCYGVQWTDSCKNSHITALNRGGRVILAAGAIHSPLILQKSGIGSLTALGEKIGSNLMNHYGCSLIFETVCDFNFSSGPLAFVPNDDHPNENRRDWQMVVGGEVLLNPLLLAKVDRDPKCGNYITFLNWILHPRTRGSIQVDYDGMPVIELKIYEDGDLKDKKSDIYTIVQSLRWMYRLVIEMRKSELLRGDGIKLVFPPEEVMLRDDSRELERWAKIGLSQTDHYCGTNSLGTVVNPDDFKVYNTDNIHVVDASVFPSISDSNTTFPVLVMSEIASDRISKLVDRK